MKKKWNYLKIIILVVIVQFFGFGIYASIEEKEMYEIATEMDVQINKLVSCEKLDYDSEYLLNMDRKIDTTMDYYLVELELYNNEIDTEYMPYFNAMDQDGNYAMLEEVEYYGEDYYITSGNHGDMIPGKTGINQKYILGIYDNWKDNLKTVSIGQQDYDAKKIVSGITFELK